MKDAERVRLSLADNYTLQLLVFKCPAKTQT